MGQHRDTPCNSFHKYPWTSPKPLQYPEGKVCDGKGSEGKGNKRGFIKTLSQSLIKLQNEHRCESCLLPSPQPPGPSVSGMARIKGRIQPLTLSQAP